MTESLTAKGVTVSLERLVAKIQPVESESLTAANCGVLAGRVLGEHVALDRDSPAIDVSAMDGYAVRAAEINENALSLRGECQIGRPPTTLAANVAMRVYTGCPVPLGADAVVRLERAEVSGETVRLKAGVAIEPGTDIRRRGENARRGDRVLSAGERVTPAAVTALASIGSAEVSLYRRLRIAVITTGDELASPEENASGELPDWRLRDSNGPTLRAMFAPLPWVESVSHAHADDTLGGLTGLLRQALEHADAVVLTGGVSKGAYDFVPEAVASAGAETMFHRLPARPGRPTLGAVAGGKPVFGLPGNPLSVLTTARRLLAPALRRRAGFAAPEDRRPAVTIVRPDQRMIPLTWWRPVRITTHGHAELVPLKGSGDTCGPAVSDGFVEVPPETAGVGPFAYYDWDL